MFQQDVLFPLPFGKLSFFSLTEPVGETETHFLFVDRLYLANRSFEGGKTLIAERKCDPVAKNVSAMAEGED